MTTLADAARVLDVEVSALEAEGPGRVWRIAALDSVRVLLSDLALANRSSTLLPVGADDELLGLEREWLSLLALADQGHGNRGTADALWSALLAVADAPAHGLTGVLVKLRVLVRVLEDTTLGAPDTPEHRLLATTVATVERLVAGVLAAEIRLGTQVDELFAAAGHVLAPIEPPPVLVEAGSRATGLSPLTVRRVYTTMMRLIGANA